MNIYNILFGRSPCDKCVVQPMCSSGCGSLNNWVSRSVRNVKLYSIIMKVGIVVFLISFTGIKMIGSYINLTLNPVTTAVSIITIFLSYPTVDLFKFKMLAYFNFKGRLNESNKDVYDNERTKLY